MPAQPGSRRSSGAPKSAETCTIPRKRTRSRELALQFLYQLDQRGGETRENLLGFLIRSDEDAQVQRFAKDLIEGVLDNLSAIDARIIDLAENWDIRRMAVVDRNVLRLATYELLYLPDVPPKVSINEAVDLAKKFSTAESGSFVNGILDCIRKQLAE